MTGQESTAATKMNQDDDGDDNNNDNNQKQQQSSSSSSSPVVIGENTCHVLPCDINYTGMAPTHVYFQPVPIDKNDSTIYASTFRGRGLLANAAALQEMTNDNENDNNAKAWLLSVEQNQTIHIKSSIDNVLEW